MKKSKQELIKDVLLLGKSYKKESVMVLKLFDEYSNKIISKEDLLYKLSKLEFGLRDWMKTRLLDLNLPEFTEGVESQKFMEVKKIFSQIKQK